MTEHSFTKTIYSVIRKHFGNKADLIFEKSELLQYLNYKTASADKGSKSRGSFANIYSIYVLIEDYLANGFPSNDKDYGKYEGAAFTKLMKRQRELPFGAKLQNHALNSRTNGEFEKFFPLSQHSPIIRDLKSQRYWINENLLIIKTSEGIFNIAQAVIEIINKYVEAKQSAFKNFIAQCNKLKHAKNTDKNNVYNFILSLMTPDMDARLFEIVSFSILKRMYADQEIYWGFSKTELKKENIKLYKTGRTNANDGGIDFVMRPLGRFFQATETLDFKKYFLDIEKLEHFPITFVIKSYDDIDTIKSTIRDKAKKTYLIERVVDEYMNCIEEIINIATLAETVRKMDANALQYVLEEIIRQSKVEFNQ